MSLYLDGTNVAMAPYSFALTTAPSQPWIAVGGYLLTDTNSIPYPVDIDQNEPNILPGSLDDMALWDRALTAGEVSAIYQQGLKHLPLTSVVESAPGTASTLTASASAGKLAISWSPNGGTLQSSPALGAGASWTTIGTTNPATVPIGPAAMFFRVVNQ